MPAQPSESVSSEDLIFACQEKLCSIIEIEIESEDGQRSPILPSKMNAYLKISDGPVEEVEQHERQDVDVSDHEVLFNVSVRDLRFAFGSAETEAVVVLEDQESLQPLSAVLTRVGSDDSD
jgi:hypothetical protein